MTWVKLCGMTRADDVAAAVELGADAVGFVIYPGSKRYIAIDRVGPLVPDGKAASYLVAVDAEPGWLTDTALELGLSGVQPHGAGAAAAARRALTAGLEVLFPIAVDGETPDISRVPEGAVPLLDTGGTGLHGGSGRTFDWDLASGVDREVVVAGGLSPENVAEAVRRSGAWGVDVASGVEKAPGMKDHDAMRRFVEAVR